MREAREIWLLLIFTILLTITEIRCQEIIQKLKPENQTNQKTKVTRTALHVARSLDPESMETLTVKTKTGDVATLIVKKREGRHSQHNQSTNSSSPIEMIPISTSSNIQETKINEKTQHKDDRLPKSVPEPVFIRSDTVLVKGQKTDLFNNNHKRGKSLLKLDSDGIPVVTGVRMPDDESDKQVWRNARVINGVLMPYDKTQPKHSYTIRHHAAALNNEKKKIYTTYQNQGSWVKMEPVPSSATNLRTTNLEPVLSSPTPTFVSSPPTTSNWQPPSAAPRPQNIVAVVGSPNVQQWNNYPQEVVKVVEDTQPILKEEDKYLQDRILEYIKSVNRQELDRHQQMKELRGSRMIDQPSVQIESFTTMDQPVKIQARNFDSKIGSQRQARNLGQPIEIEARMIQQPVEIQPRNLGPPLEMEARMIPQPINLEQPLEMEARMLQVPGESVYPTSMMYSPQGTQSSSLRSSVEEGVRTPVLQYAHPELGVQSADIESRYRAIDEANERHRQEDRSREQAIAYFSHDIHADRSPFAFEPGLEDDDGKVNENAQRSHGDSLPTFKPNKKVSKLYYAQPPNGKYYGKQNENYQNNQYERPFWERIGDTIREHVQTGMDRMSEMTRPVVEPIVEATHKITHNLGLGHNRELTTFKEKLGVVQTPSVILPALGLVAGGAALGLGAVAVGRYLDVDMLKRSGGNAERIGEDQLEMEHKRALSSIVSLPIDNTDESWQPIYNSTNETSSTNPATPTNQITPTNQEQPLSESTTDRLIESLQRRRRDLLQDVDAKETISGTNSHLSGSTLWNNTPCAKKTFCNAMLSQTGDDIIVMEKKMATYLAMLSSNSKSAIGLHLDDVMAAVKNRDCSAFHCRHDLSDIPVPR